MHSLYHCDDLLQMHEIVIHKHPETGEYVWEKTGNRAEFRILSHGPVGEGASRRTYEARRVNGISGRLRLKQCISTEHSAQQRFLRTALLQQKLLDHPDTVNATAGLFGVYLGEDGHLWEAQDFRDSQCYNEVEESSVHSALTHLRYFTEAVYRYHTLDGEAWLLLDLSPSNLSVFRSESGINGACFFDFDSMLTAEEVLQNQSLFGSQHYTAPEVAWPQDGQSIDCRADIYSLGVILFEKLLGRYPDPESESYSFSEYDFTDCTNPQLLQNLSSAAKEALTEFFQHTIANDADFRYENTNQMLQAIDHLLELTNPAGVQIPRLTRQNIRPTSNFLGRDDVLCAIHEAFETSNCRSVILHGVGGAGKSETARQYAALHQEDYAGINFLVCTPEDSNWETLVDRLEFASGGTSELDRHNLIILDNFDCADPALMRSVLMDFLEHTGEARVLVTTRSCRMPALPRCEELPLVENDQLALAVFRANYPHHLSTDDAATVRTILSAVDFNTYAADMIARELAARPEMNLTQFLERMQFFGIRALSSAEVSTGKDKDYTPAPFTRQVEKLFADVLSHDFTLQQKLILFLLINAPARYFSRTHICRMVGDHTGTTLADQAVEQLLRRNWLRQTTTYGPATIGVHPLAAEALSGKLTVTGEMLRTVCVNLLTMTDIGESFFQELYFLVSARRYPDWPAEILAGCQTEAQRTQEHLRNTMILKALNARLASLKLPVWLDSPLRNLGAGFGISAVAGDGEAARYFCYLEEANLSLQYLEIAHRDYSLNENQISVEFKEVCPKGNDTITLLRVTTGDDGDQTFDLSVLKHGAPEQRRALHSPAYCPRTRKARSHRVYLEAEKYFCRISPKDFRGGFPAVPVTRIGARAFLGLDTLRHIVLPETVLDIEHDAFRYCGLTEVIIPGAAGRVTIGDMAFFGCDALTKVALSEGIFGIFSSAFSDCSALTEVSFPSSLAYLGDNAFSRTGLKSLTLPEGPAMIGMGAFRETPLETVRLPDSMKVILPLAFSCCKNLKDLRLGNGVIRIGRGSFWGCESLPYLRLPDSLQFVEPVAFDSCFALKTLSLPGSVEFEGLALENCPLEMVLLRSTPTHSLQQQLAANPPQHILTPLSPSHYMRFCRYENQYIPHPEILPAADLDVL